VPNESPAAQPLTAEQLATHERPSAPDISPDGSRVAYVVAPVSKDVDKDKEHGVAAIWVVGASEGEPRQFTSGLWEDGEPRWSPDGTRLAFLSDRAERGKQSVYVMPADGGEGVRVFQQQGSLSTLRWAPDGRYLSVLFTDPETDEEKEKKENKDDVKVWDAEPKWRRLWLIDMEGQNARSVSPQERQVWGYAWAPDGKLLAINSSPNPRLNDIFGETRVDIVDLSTSLKACPEPVEGAGSDGGELRELLRLTGTAANLLWSADGSKLAYQSTNGKVTQAEHIFVAALDGGAPVDITPDLAATVEDIVPLAGGQAILAHIAYGVNSSFRSVRWDGEIAPTLVDEDPWGYFTGAPSASRDGSVIAAVWEDGANAPDVWVLNVETHEASRRTHLNPKLERAALGKQEIVRWESDPGIEVEAVLIKPYGFEEGKRYPLVVQVHGGPTSHWPNAFYADWHDWGQYLAGRGIAVLMHNPRGSTGYGSEFMNALHGEIGGVELRDLLSGVDAMIERGIADPRRLGIGGWSWGGYMTAWTVTQTDRFKAAVMGAGLPNMVSDNSIGDIPGANLSYFEKSPYEDPDPLWERSAIRYIRNCTTPVLIVHGEADERVNMFQSVEMHVALRELGKEHQFVTYPREPHGIREKKHQIDLIERVGKWFEARL
jgi:dipeptidyl aminopeptidase/acylaminoacyl peptidase